MIFGAYSGLGYSASLFLNDCHDAGFELSASVFMVYQIWKNPGFTQAEKILLPIPDYTQVALSLYYMFACITKSNADVAAFLVFMAKYFQGAVLPYITLMTYLNGPQHQPFLTTFTLMKLLFNINDTTFYLHNTFGFLPNWYQWGI
jgi:hypothetical protein